MTSYREISIFRWVENLYNNNNYHINNDDSNDYDHDVITTIVIIVITIRRIRILLLLIIQDKGVLLLEVIRFISLSCSIFTLTHDRSIPLGLIRKSRRFFGNALALHC